MDSKEVQIQLVSVDCCVIPFSDTGCILEFDFTCFVFYFVLDVSSGR